VIALRHRPHKLRRKSAETTPAADIVIQWSRRAREVTSKMTRSFVNVTTNGAGDSCLGGRNCYKPAGGVIFVLSSLLFSITVSVPMEAGVPRCPASMSSAVEAKLLPVLDATSEALRRDDWSAKTYEALLDALLAGSDDASVEARVALMDYPVGTAYAEQLSCVVSIGGPKALHFLRLYSRCNIAPSRSPVPRQHSSKLRAMTLKAWKAGHGKGSCEAD
jgi:hypothetical protein